MVSSDCYRGIENESLFYHLPPEILNHVFSHLSNRDFKILRLTSAFFRDTVPFRLDRVFLSANPRNIEVFRAVADDEVFRKRIVEIVWDDARLKKHTRVSNLTQDPYSVWSWDHSCPQWFAKECKKNLREMLWRKGEDVDRPDHVARKRQCDHAMPLSDCWAYYEKLVEQQDKVISTGADEEALKHGLKRFPSLRKITITPTAHGFLYETPYDTPMIRNFPYGFNYAIPRGWPPMSGDEPVVAHAWNRATKSFKDKWRGFRIITRVLAREEHQVAELILNTHGLELGLNHHIFDAKSEEQADLAMMLKRPGFRRIDLALTVSDARQYNWRSYRSGCLRAALAKATDLEHVGLFSNVQKDYSYPDSDGEDDVTRQDFVPLRTILPIDKWPNLRHFGLSRFMVKQSDVIALLSALPHTLQSVELSYLLFVDGGGNYHDLLQDMRDKLEWGERRVKPQVMMAIHTMESRPGRDVWINNEVFSFMYYGGENPIGGLDKNKVYQGNGIMRDQFNPAFERPYASFVELAQLGIRKLSQREKNMMESGNVVKDCIETDRAARERCHTQ